MPAEGEGEATTDCSPRPRPAGGRGHEYAAGREPQLKARKTEHLRVLIANQRTDRLAFVVSIVVAFGHVVITREIDLENPVSPLDHRGEAILGVGLQRHPTVDHILALTEAHEP